MGGRAAQQAITSEYSPQNVFTIDESAYFYYMVPSTSVSKASIQGRKKVKKRITVTLTTNADGSDKVPLLFVGSVRQSRCFEGSSAEQLGIDSVRSA